MPTCRDCCGRGQVLRQKTLGDQAPKSAWAKCSACAGSGKVAEPTLFRWPKVRQPEGQPDRCDQCDQPAELWSFELAEDEVALCLGCLEALYQAIGKVATTPA